MASPGFLSKRIKKVSQSGLTSDRYEYLGLNQAEPDLGDPLIGISSIGAKPKPISGDVYVLAAYSSQSNNGINSNRYWVSSIDLTSGLSLTPGSFTVFNNDVQVGLANSFNKFNFVGSGVTVSAVGAGVSEQTGIATITISVVDAIAKGGFSAVQYHGASGLIQGASDFSFDPNTNRVGIGSTLPRHKLDVSGNIIVSGISTFSSGPVIINSLTDTGTSNQKLQVTGNAYISEAIGVGTTNPTDQIDIRGTTKTSHLNVTGLSTFTGVVNATGGLNVTGVTTTNSLQVSVLTNTTNLSVSGFSTFSGISTFGDDVFVKSDKILYLTNFADRFGSTGSNGSRLVRDSVGIAWTTASEVAAGGTIGNVQFHSSTGLINGNNGFNYDFTNQRVGIGTTLPTQSLQVGSGTTNVFVVNQTGSTGIGTTNPQYKLDVRGDTNISGNLTVSGVSTINISVGSVLNFGSTYIVGVGTTVVTGTATTTLSSLGITSFRSVKYQIQIAQNSDFQATDILVIHNGTTANLIEYGSIATGEYLGAFDASIGDGNLNLTYTPNVSAAATVSFAYHGMRII